MLYFSKDLPFSKCYDSFQFHQQAGSRVSLAPYSHRCSVLSVFLHPYILMGRLFRFDHSFHISGRLLRLPQGGRSLENQHLWSLTLALQFWSVSHIHPYRSIAGLLAVIKDSLPQGVCHHRCQPHRVWAARMMMRSRGKGLWKLFFKAHTGSSHDHSLLTWLPVDPFQVFSDSKHWVSINVN